MSTINKLANILQNLKHLVTFCCPKDLPRVGLDEHPQDAAQHDDEGEEEAQGKVELGLLMHPDMLTKLPTPYLKSPKGILTSAAVEHKLINLGFLLSIEGPESIDFRRPLK